MKYVVNIKTQFMCLAYLSHVSVCVRVCYIGLAADEEVCLEWGCQNMLRYDDTRWMGGKFIRLENF